MRRLKPKQRRERVRENYRDAMEEAGRDPGEPGLRDVYPAISRAPVRLCGFPRAKAVTLVLRRPLPAGAAQILPLGSIEVAIHTRKEVGLALQRFSGLGRHEFLKT